MFFSDSLILKIPSSTTFFSLRYQSMEKDHIEHTSISFSFSLEHGREEKRWGGGTNPHHMEVILEFPLNMAPIHIYDL